ncbi:CPBP family glutamic-type intramembrane protease [Phytohabitans sp. LJ34]|uniref:CPBP family glutamic-type intramembrane protease n=1 Tax=Phytohabitans sp. LJ34 TaxID=3452217 RepID=UPI003F8A2A38
MDETATAPPRPATGVWLAVEFLALFFGVVGVYTLAGSPGSPIPFLVVGAIAAYVYLRRQRGFERRDLTRAAAVPAALPAILAGWAVAAVVGVVVLALAQPEQLFELPREEPLIWAIVVVFYPLLSVYPQELIYRAFLLHRYAPLLGTGAGAAAASAAAFGFAHVIFGNVLSVVLTLAGGWIFARRYQKTRSLLTVSVEHALYGVLAFTIGFGDLFYHGAA